MKFTCIILGGGESRRMGRDKKFIKYNGKTFIEHIYEFACEICDEVIISIAKKEDYEKLKHLRAKFVFDKLKIKTPLIGICSSAEEISNEFVVVLPCDSPKMNKDIFEYMKKVIVSGNFDAVVPKSEKGYYALHAIYRRKTLLEACKKVLRNSRTVRDILKEMNVQFIDVEFFKKFDKDLITFFNINTEEDLKKFLKMVGE